MPQAASFLVDPADPTPLHAQLERGIRVAIASGRLAVGVQLPTVRQLAVDLRLNANTVAKVYGHLERDGVLETRRGVGTFVTAAATRRDGNAAARRAALQALAQRTLADAASHGFRPDEVIRAIEALLKEHHGGETD